MKTEYPNIRSGIPLPSFLKPLFWDTAFNRLTWNGHKDFIIQRILVEGDWMAVQWLRRNLGDEVLLAWILQHKGRGLDKRRLRFWELILPLPKKTVDAWLQTTHNTPWERRLQP